MLHLTLPVRLAALGLLQVPLYLLTRSWGAQPPLHLFIAVFGVQFVLYLVAVWLVLRKDHGSWKTDECEASRRDRRPVDVFDPSSVVHHPWSMVRRPSSVVVILGLAVLFRILGVLSYPSLSDDMFRYVWDGRVQAAGISPYAYSPGAAELAPLRDDTVWPHINRKEAVTIYPPAAQLLFRLIHAAGGYNIWAFKGAMALADLLTIGLLIGLLRSISQPDTLVIIYAWSPLTVYELTANGHMEALMLPCLALALLAARRSWDTTAGAALAAATMMKLFPALLLPALWGRRRWRMPVAFGVTCLALALPYASDGLRVATYYPTYLREQYNMSLAALLGEALRLVGVADPYRLVQLLLLAAVTGVGLWHLAHPDPARFLVRGVWMIGLLTVFSQFLHPWYMVWLLPFLAALAPRAVGQASPPTPRLEGEGGHTTSPCLSSPPSLRGNPHATRGAAGGVGELGLPPAPLHPAHWLGWLIFSGTVVLSYHFYIREQWNFAVVVVEYLPLYLLLLWPYLKRVLQQRHG